MTKGKGQMNKEGPMDNAQWIAGAEGARDGVGAAPAGYGRGHEVTCVTEDKKAGSGAFTFSRLR